MRLKSLVHLLPLYVITALSLTTASAQFYVETNFISDVAGKAPVHDTHLVNPWGLTFAPGGPWWVSDNRTGVSTVYTGTGQIVNEVVTIPTASGTGTGSPTGIVYNTQLASFVFVTMDGTVSAWNGGTSAVIKVTKAGASYTGATLAVRGGKTLLYVADAAGGIDVYDQNFIPVVLGSSAFHDPRVPANSPPYNIQALVNSLIVTFSGPGGNFVDEFDVNGNLKLAFQTGAFLSAPWGVALAPVNFGTSSKSILVGNLGSGKIASFNPGTGHFRGFLLKAAATPIVIQDLWGIAFGNGGSAGPTNSLFFTAGTGGYAHGTFGTITVAP